MLPEKCVAVGDYIIESDGNRFLIYDTKRDRFGQDYAELIIVIDRWKNLNEATLFGFVGAVWEALKHDSWQR